MISSTFTRTLTIILSLPIFTLIATSAVSASEVNVELLAMQRDTPDGGELTGPNSPGDAYYSLKQEDFEPDTTPGLRVTLDTEIGDHDYIFSAFVIDAMQGDGLFGNTTTISLSTDARYDLDPGSDLDTSNASLMEWMDAEHKTTLFGAEVNRVIPAEAIGLTQQKVYYGVRGLYLGEKLKSIAYDETDDLPGGGGNDVDRGEIKTKNRLLGMQMGIQGDKQLSNKVTFAWDAKLGLYANFAQRDRKFSTDNNNVVTPLSDEIDDTLFSQTIEINPRINVSVSKNTSLSFGANVLWVNGISAAGAHFATLTDLDDNSIRGKDSALFYSLNAGINIGFD